jgi:hypothetical protein
VLAPVAIVAGDLFLGELAHEQVERQGGGVSASPAATDNAIRLAAKVAIDAGDYEGARALLGLLQARPNRSASVVKLRG